MTVDAGKIREYVELFDGDVVAAAKALQRYAHAEMKPKSRRQVSGEVLLSVKDVAKTYKLGRHKISALGGISLDVHKGEFLALTGASGSGKSTLLQLMGGLDKPTSGEITIDGTNINRLSDAKLSRFRNETIGFVFQFFYLQSFLRLNKNIEVPGMFARSDRKEREIRVHELIEKVGLSDRETHFPKELSGGQMQRAAIARALLNSPKILLADEPTGNLDSKNSDAVIELFEQIRDELGMTVVIVTHNPEIAARADREIRLGDGVIV